VFKQLKTKFSSKLNSLDIHTLEVLKKSSASLVVKVLGMLAGLAISIILGRTLGAEGLGIINLANRIVAFVLVFLLLGLGDVIVKEIAIAFERNDMQHVANVTHTARLLIIPLGVVVSLALLYTTPRLVQDFFEEPRLRLPLIISLSVIAFRLLSRIYASSVNGFRKIWQSSLVNETLSAFIVVLGLAISLVFGIRITVISVAALYAGARIVVTLVFFLYWRTLFTHKLKPRNVSRSLLIVGIPLLIASSSGLIQNNADIIMLGWLSSSAEVGLYSVAARLGLLTSFVHLVTASSLSPKIASLFAENKHLEMKQMVQKITRLLAFVGISSFIFYLVLGKPILSLWGDEFISAYWALLIIAFGQLFNITTGATGIMLIMTGHERIIGFITLGSAIVSISMNLLLIPEFGAIGAAIATGSTLILENLIKLIVVYKKLGVLTISFKRIHD
jgi:O-antigen/teichoic acid export membrane protein